jgi:transcriptional regulator with XRE-family HTH domain
MIAVWKNDLRQDGNDSGSPSGALVRFGQMPRTLHNHLKRGYGNRLRKARIRAGLSQRSLAFSGCTAAYISRIEANERYPSMQLIHELAARLDVDPHWLATGERAGPHDDLRAQLRAAHARIRHLESKLAAVSRIIRD